MNRLFIYDYCYRLLLVVNLIVILNAIQICIATNESSSVQQIQVTSNKNYGNKVESHKTGPFQSELLLHRNKRVVFLRNSGVGYFVALAIPATPNEINRHVFVAFNFEANYGLPDNTSLSLLKTKFEGRQNDNDGVGANANANEEYNENIMNGDDENNKKELNDDDKMNVNLKENSTIINKNRRKRKINTNNNNNNSINKMNSKGMFTRKRFYKVLEKELFQSGFNGTSCLLKTICETSQEPLYEHNGVFGNIFHILFTPSSSEDENLPLPFYTAELNGLNNECNFYEPHCPKSLLHFITTMI